MSILLVPPAYSMVRFAPGGGAGSLPTGRVNAAATVAQPQEDDPSRNKPNTRPRGETGNPAKDESSEACPPSAMPSSGERPIALGARVVTIEGELDFGRNPISFSLVAQVILESDGAAVVLDLHACTYIDRSALGELVDLVRWARSHQVEVILAGPAPAVQRVLDITRLSQFFTVMDTLEEALQP